MTSEERKEIRYRNRKRIREEKKQNFLNNMPTYEEVFTFEHLYNSFQLCKKNVTWKPSIQIFQQNLTIELVKLLDELHSSRGFHTDGFIEFQICERGKMRNIKSVSIRERVVQRCFCDYYLIPLLTHNLIYDNGASLKNKGVTFTLDRLKKHLHNYYHKYNTNEGYILLYDFSNYFNSIDHEALYSKFDPLMLDEKCRKLFHHLVDAFGDVGLGLGSQVSQVSAVAFPNKLDHYLQQYETSESSARYMDDGYVIFHSKQDAENCLIGFMKILDEYKITINKKKVKIVSLKNYFIFLKKRFRLTETGAVIVKLSRNNVAKHKRRINKLINMTHENKLDIKDVELAHKTWIGQLKRYKNQKSIYDADKTISEKIKTEVQRNE